MIMNPFIYDIIACFVLGGIWVLLSSLAAQHFGGKIGGFIAGLPSTAVLAIFFITYTEGARHGFDVASVFPLAISVNAVFLAAFAAFSSKSFSTGLLISLGIWVLIESVCMYFRPVHFGVIVTLGILLFLVSFFYISRLHIPDPGIRPVRHGMFDMFIRAVSGGSIIVLAMLGSRLGGPVLGGILSAFPGTVVATLIISDAYGGRDLTRVMARPMMVSGVINCMVFAFAYRHTVMHMHVINALTISYAITLVSAACTYYWLNIYHREHGHAIHT